jgi:uncharacterized protein YdhG (YjbR/CyaY superfamily)
LCCRNLVALNETIAKTMKNLPAANMDEYIAGFPKDIQKVLEQVRVVIQKAAPKAAETIKYTIPTFTLNGNLVSFAAYKNHIGLYPAPREVQALKKELSSYAGNKSTLQLSLDKPIPVALITKIVKYLVKRSAEKAKTKNLISKKAKPSGIGDYIKTAPKEARGKLREMHACIRAAAPGAIESLKWGMPAFSFTRILVTFAAFKHHIGFYPTPSAVTAFEKQLSKYKTAKGSIQFPLDKPLPLSLIRKITQFRVRESADTDAKWKP